MDAPDELRRAVREAAQDAARAWKVADVPDDVGAWDHFYQHMTDAVLAVPAIADALADAARLRSLAAMFDLFDNRDQSFTGAQVAAMLRDES